MAEDTIKKPPVTTDEIATLAKDIDVFAGWLRRLENPDPVLRTEAAGKGLKLYDEVDRDAHAGSVLQQRILAVVGKEWDVIPAESARKSGRPASTTREQVVADFVSKTLESCNFDQARQELLKANLYGYYCAEVMWQVLRGDIRIRKIIGKHPRRFTFTPERELRLLTPANMIDGEAVPDRKFITFTCGDSDNPYGRGLGQRLWWPVWFKKNGVKFWLVFLEKFGMPTVWGKYPAGAAPAQQQALMDAIEAIQTDTGIKTPDSMGLELLEASRAGTVTHEQLCEYMDRQISKAVLGQTATTEGTPGKLGNEDSQGDVKQEIVEADADLLDACINDTVIPWIVDYNFPGVDEYPQFKTFAAPKPDLKEQSEIDKTLAVDIGLPIGTAYFYETYGIPVPEEGEELVKPAPMAQPNPSSVIPAPAGIQGKQFAEAGSDAADLIADRLGADASPAADALMAPVQKLIDTADSLEAVRDGIIALYDEMDPADLGALIARAMMVAEMTGRYEVAEETGKKKALKTAAFAESPEDQGLFAVFNLPFAEQERFFQSKLNIPTRKWTDLWKAQHAKGFMVAGAYKADLLADLREAVEKAISGGATLADFRRDFDDIVGKYGWSYKGGRNWRSAVIYNTNVRTSYAAGRWEQLQDPDVRKFYGYLVYRHGDSRVPRPIHLSWDGVTLPAVDPWWNTHYVPNGWGCKCKVFAATREEWEAAGSKGKAPASPIDPKTGEPVGIDKGWGYNVGKAAREAGYRVLTEKFESMPYDVARKWIASYVDEPAYRLFIEGGIGGEFPVAVLNEAFRKEIGARHQTVWMSETTRTKNGAAHPELTIADYRILPDAIENAQTVIRDGDQTMVFIRMNDKLYHAVVKTTQSGKRDYLTSFRLTDTADMARMKRRGTVLKDEI